MYNTNSENKIVFTNQSTFGYKSQLKTKTNIKCKYRGVFFVREFMSSLFVMKGVNHTLYLNYLSKCQV